MSKTIDLPCYIGNIVYFAEEYYCDEAEIEEKRINENTKRKKLLYSGVYYTNIEYPAV